MTCFCHFNVCSSIASFVSYFVNSIYVFHSMNCEIIWKKPRAILRYIHIQVHIYVVYLIILLFELDKICVFSRKNIGLRNFFSTERNEYIPYRPLFLDTGILENLFDPSQIIIGEYAAAAKFMGLIFSILNLHFGGDTKL